MALSVLTPGTIACQCRGKSDSGGDLVDQILRIYRPMSIPRSNAVVSDTAMTLSLITMVVMNV